MATTTLTYSTPGTYSWQVPAGIDSIQIECWGSGAPGSAVYWGGSSWAGGGAGGGGGYARKSISVNHGDTYNITVGIYNLTPGDSYFKYKTTNLCYATGGNFPSPDYWRGVGGAGTIGDTLYSGGHGGALGTDEGGEGTGGGGGAGSLGNGYNGNDGNGGGGSGGGSRDNYGGSGGDGEVYGADGKNGNSYGGGGGGGGYDASGGTGASGLVIITYTTPTNVSYSIDNIGRHSPESNEKNRLAHLGRSVNKGVPKSEEAKRHLSLAHPDMHGPNNPMYGRKHSIETRLKLSAKAKLHIGIKNPFYGKHHTVETIAKLKKLIPTNAHKVFCHNNNQTYPSINEAGRKTGMSAHTVLMICKRLKSDFKGYQFSFA